jgi:hypothetical protein
MVKVMALLSNNSSIPLLPRAIICMDLKALKKYFKGIIKRI